MVRASRTRGLVALSLRSVSRPGILAWSTPMRPLPWKNQKQAQSRSATRAGCSEPSGEQRVFRGFPIGHAQVVTMYCM